MSSSAPAPPPPPKDQASPGASMNADTGTGAKLSAVVDPRASSLTKEPSDASHTSTNAGDRGKDKDKDDVSQWTAYELSERTQKMLDSIVPTHPLISESLPLSSLREEYENGSGRFVEQIDHLRSQGFVRIRRTRGDGDCFYRSIAFAWIHRMLTVPTHHQRTLTVAKTLSLLDDTSLVHLKAAGFQELVYDDFYQVLTSLIRQIIVPEPDGTTLTEEVLMEAFQDSEVSNCIVVFLRLLTSAVIRTDPDTYAPFLFHPETGDDITPKEFCERFVEVCGKEADHVQITALTKVLKLNIEVAYLDGHGEDGSVNFVSFQNVPPEYFDRPPVLLYRPGHYDILEKALASDEKDVPL